MNTLDKQNLDRRVAEALGWHLDCTGKWIDTDQQFKGYHPDFSPSTNWLQAGELMLEYKISVEWYENLGVWSAWIGASGEAISATTPQKAICMVIIEAHKK